MVVVALLLIIGLGVPLILPSLVSFRTLFTPHPFYRCVNFRGRGAIDRTTIAAQHAI